MLKIVKPFFWPVLCGLLAAFVVILALPTYFGLPASNYFSQNSYASGIQKAMPSVVSIYSTAGLGSGVIYSEKGVIVTNYHVIENAGNITVELNNGKDYPATLIGKDIETDIAILSIKADGLLPFDFNKTDDIKVGDIVFSIGNPYGVGPTATMGIVSAMGRSQGDISKYQNFIQTDAAINPGNSGGALINANGEFVGLISVLFSGSQGIGFAIPAKQIRTTVSQIIEHGEVIRGYMGASLVPLTPAQTTLLKLKYQGLLVTRVEEGGPAYNAQLRQGDVVIGIDGQPIYGYEMARNTIVKIMPGKTTPIQFIRGSNTYSTNVLFSKRPSNNLTNKVEP